MPNRNNNNQRQPRNKWWFFGRRAPADEDLMTELEKHKVEIASGICFLLFCIAVWFHEDPQEEEGGVKRFFKDVGNFFHRAFGSDKIIVVIPVECIIAILNPIATMFIVAMPVTALYIKTKSAEERARMQQDAWIGWWIATVDTVLSHVPFLN